jgi:hypothetical protein
LMGQIRCVFVVGGAFAAAFGLSHAVDWAEATGIPTTEALFYGGVLQEGGTLAEGSRTIGATVWRSADSTDAGERLCTAEPAVTDVVRGHFRLALPAACEEVLKTETEVWVEVEVEGRSLGRNKTGAVPFAVTAARARTSDMAESASEALNFHVPGDLRVDGDVAFDGDVHLRGPARADSLTVGSCAEWQPLSGASNYCFAARSGKPLEARDLVASGRVSTTDFSVETLTGTGSYGETTDGLWVQAVGPIAGQNLEARGSGIGSGPNTNEDGHQIRDLTVNGTLRQRDIRPNTEVYSPAPFGNCGGKLVRGLQPQGRGLWCSSE